MARATVLLLWLGLLESGAGCTIPTRDGAGTVTLTELADTPDLLVKGSYADYEFAVALCRPLTFVDLSCPDGTSVCDRRIATPTQPPRGTSPWGAFSNMVTEWVTVDGEDQLRISYSQLTKFVLIMLTCNPDVGSPTLQPTSETGTRLELVGETSAVCNRADGGSGAGRGGGGDDDLDIGMVLCIVFFLSGGIYFAGGFALRHYKFSKEGWDRVPNKDFWAAQPGLVKDGFLFTFAKIRGMTTGGSSPSYEPLPE